MANIKKSIYKKLEENYYNQRGREHEFKHDALVELELTEHPKSHMLYELAYNEGHANGYSDIFFYMEMMSELLK